jgi:hypothetical protein
MATFKLAKKDAVSDTRTNIYDLHEKKLQHFESEKKKLESYVLLLEKYKNEKEPTHETKDKIKDLELKINDIENETGLNEYLLDFFSTINQNKEDFKENDTKGKMDSFIHSKVNHSKTELYNNYIYKFNPELVQLHNVKNSRNTCKNCNSEDLIFDQRLSTHTCTECGTCVHNICNEQSAPVYTENIEQVIVFNYKRNNHFQECMNQLQAKENTSIPPQIIKDLTAEFKKYNITDPKMFTPKLIKIYLKKLKYNKYYEHIPTIINEFCGLRAPKMTPELEQQLKIMFDEIQIPFEKYSKMYCPERKNFLNYNYIFYKMCELLNKDEYLVCFPLLKSREKLYEHDLIWKGICNDLRWEFIASI